MIKQFNPFLCKSEGMRRLSIVLSAVCLFVWFGWIGVVSEGFTKIKPEGWTLLVAAPVAVYVIILILIRTMAWIIRGFRN